MRQVQALVTGDQDPAEVALFWLERRSGRLPPEKRMMYAIIEHAVHDIRHMRTAGQLSSALKMAQIRQRTTAIAWVYSDDTTWSHSFLNCCEALGWLPAMVREQIRQDIESTEPLTCGAPDAPRSTIANVEGDPNYHELGWRAVFNCRNLLMGCARIEEGYEGKAPFGLLCKDRPACEDSAEALRRVVDPQRRVNDR